MTSTETLVPVQTRRERPTGVRRGDFTPLSKRDLTWKFSPVDAIATLVESDLDGSRIEASVSGALTARVDLSWIDSTDPRVGLAGLPEDRAVAAAWDSARKVLLVSVSGEQSDEIVLSLSGFDRGASALHVLIDVAPQSHTNMSVHYRGSVLLCEAVELLVGDGSSFNVTYCYEESTASAHVGAHFSRLGRDAQLTHALVVLSGGVVRVNPSTHLASAGASVEMLGLYTPGDNEHVEHHVYVNHDAPHTKSNVLYKGALRSSTSRAVWIGDVLIGALATGTDSYEQNRNLILTEGARADSVPNLEIETGDIVGAGHASATGRFDEEQLFYLESRGIPESEARMLVVRGFLNEVAQKLGSAKVTALVEETLDRQFSEGIPA
jgi:Fe-S cluster assembly protein SufD